LEWEASYDSESGLDHYEVWVDDMNVASVPAGTTSYTTSARSDGSHQWYIRAVDVVGNSTQSASTFTFTVDTTAPGAPTGLWALAASSSRIDLDWNSNPESDLDHYNVYRSTTSGFTPDFGNPVRSPSSSDYSDTGLAPSTTYYYRVTAVDRSGNESGPSVEVSATTLPSIDNIPPDPPTGLSAAPISSSQISLNWADNPENDLDYYNIYRSTTSGFTPDFGNPVGSASLSYYPDAGLTPITTYYYKVTAVDKSGNESDP